MKIDRREQGKSRLPTVAAVSAGGVVFRRRPKPEEGRYEIVLVGQSHSGRWGLPKGTPSPGETLEQAALREVKEETGIEARIVSKLGRIEYWFGAKGVRFHKTVHFFLMEATGGDTSQHDFEHDLVEWFTVPAGLSKMTYGNEKEVVGRAESALRAGG